jgi:DNA-binding NarL/FixJ family response regulator
MLVSESTASTGAIKSLAAARSNSMKGQSIIPPSMWLDLARLLQLSSREAQLVQHIFDDQKLASIAFGLGISPKTVETYMQRLYTKLHVSSRPQLILRVMAEYLVSSCFSRAHSNASRAQATGEDPT